MSQVTSGRFRQPKAPPTVTFMIQSAQPCTSTGATSGKIVGNGACKWEQSAWGTQQDWFIMNISSDCYSSNRTLLWVCKQNLNFACIYWMYLVIFVVFYQSFQVHVWSADSTRDTNQHTLFSKFLLTSTFSTRLFCIRRHRSKRQLRSGAISRPAVQTGCMDVPRALFILIFV